MVVHKITGPEDPKFYSRALGAAGSIDLSTASVTGGGTLGLDSRDRLQELVNRCLQRIELNPDAPLPQLRLGRILELAGRREEALAAYESALERDYPWQNLEPRVALLSAEIALELPPILRDRRLEGARSLISKHEDLGTNAAAMIAAAALVRGVDNDWRNALKLAAESASIDPLCGVRAYSALGQLYTEQELHRDAYDTYALALDHLFNLNPQSSRRPALELAAGRAGLRAHKLELAEPHLVAALNLWPQSYPPPSAPFTSGPVSDQSVKYLTPLLLGKGAGYKCDLCFDTAAPSYLVVEHLASGNAVKFYIDHTAYDSSLRFMRLFNAITALESGDLDCLVKSMQDLAPDTQPDREIYSPFAIQLKRAFDGALPVEFGAMEISKTGPREALRGGCEFAPDSVTLTPTGTDVAIVVTKKSSGKIQLEADFLFTDGKNWWIKREGLSTAEEVVVAVSQAIAMALRRERKQE